MFCGSLFVLWSLFLLAIVLSVLLWLTASDYTFGIFRAFLDFIPGFINWVCVIQSVLFCVVLCRPYLSFFLLLAILLCALLVFLFCHWPFYCVPYLSFCSAIGHSIVCPTCLCVLLLAILLCALLRFTASYYYFSILKPLVDALWLSWSQRPLNYLAFQSIVFVSCTIF